MSINSEQALVIKVICALIFTLCISTLSFSIHNMTRQNCKPLIVIFYCFITVSCSITAAVMVLDLIRPKSIYSADAIGRFSFHEFFLNLVSVCYLGIFLIVGASMLQLGQSFDLIFKAECKRKARNKQKMVGYVFLIFVAISLSLLLLITLTYGTKQQYGDQITLAWVKIGCDTLVGIVNLVILIQLHRKLQNFSNENL